MATSLPPAADDAHIRSAHLWLTAACAHLRDRLRHATQHRQGHAVEPEPTPPAPPRDATSLPIDDLAAQHGLDALDVEILTLAVAPHVDVDMRDAIARFNDNLLANVVDVRLCVEFLADDPLQRLALRAHLAPEAPLLRSRLLTLGPSRDSGTDNLLGQELVPTSRALRRLLGTLDRLDPTLAAVATLTQPTTTLERVVLPTGTLTSLLRLVDAPQPQTHAGLVLAITGPAGTGKTLLVEALAQRVQRPLLTVDMTRWTALTDAEQATLLGRAVDHAADAGTVLALEGLDTWVGAGGPRPGLLRDLLVGHPGLVIVTARDPGALVGDVARLVTERVALPLPGPKERAAIVRLHAPAGVAVAGDDELLPLMGQSALTGAELRSAVALAVRHARAADPAAPVLTGALLLHACQEQVRATVAEHAVRRKPGLTLSELVVPDDTRADILELLTAARQRGRVMHQWGFDQKLSSGRGLIALFSGESGTGKTLCAAMLAEALDQPLFQISIPRVVSKWVGETEKNLEAIFTTARAARGVLLFDEADALFAGRTAVETSVDRHSNMATNVLLQEIEQFDGIVLLTTNLDKNIDRAFQRRIGFKIQFPLPDAEGRARIWQTLLPRTCPVDADIDWRDVGARFELSGGLIQNAVLRAAYQAAAEQRPLALAHVEFAARQVCKDAGKVFRTAQDDRF